MNALEKAAKIAIESDKLTKDWSSASMSQIISHILNTHHVFMKDAMAELEAHLVKEEENLFPMIIEYEQSKNDSLKLKILKFIDDTESEHDTAGDVFKELAKITGDYTAPENACASYRRTYSLLNDLEKGTFNHIHLENTVLFGKL